MGQQIGFVLGVSILVIVLGSSTGSASDFHSFVHGWWWSAGITIAAILTCIPLLMRTKAADPSTSAEPESAGVGRNQFHRWPSTRPDRNEENRMSAPRPGNWPMPCRHRAEDR